MTYSDLETLIGDFLGEIGTDRTRWTQAKRRIGITWAERLAARYLPDDEKSILIADYTVTGTVITAAVKSSINFSSFGPRVYKVLNLSGIVDSRRKDFVFVPSGDERMFANLNRQYGYWWNWRSGSIYIYHPIALASITPITLEALNYPPSQSDLYLYFTQATPANVPIVGDILHGTTSLAVGTVTEVGALSTTTHWLRYTLTSGTFLSTEAFTVTAPAGSVSHAGTITHASSAFGVDLCPFPSNEQNIAKGAAGYLLDQDGERKSGVLLTEFYQWLGISAKEAKNGG